MTVAIPLLDSLIIQMQDRFSDEDRQACQLLCLMLTIIVNKALQLDDELEGMLFWEKDIPFLKFIGNEEHRKHSGSQKIASTQPFISIWCSRWRCFSKHLLPSGHCLHPTDHKHRSLAVVFTDEMNQDLL